MFKVKIAPSILSANFANLGQELIDITKAGADYIHLDVMDGHFVPNITFGPQLIKSIRPYSNLPFDSHLMIENLKYFIPLFADVGSDIITIHVEAEPDISKNLNIINSLGIKAGISLKPTTDWQAVIPYINMIDRILIMTVEPGFGGQQFMHNQISKIYQLSQYVKQADRYIEIAVDGGIDQYTSPLATKAGANILVAGSYIFGSSDYSLAISNLKNY